MTDDVTEEMTVKDKIDAYLEKHSQWASQLRALRKILQGTELDETVKWGAPSYTLDGKIVASIVGFKNHCALWFHQGVFLKDKAGKLLNAQEGTTRGLRQWRFQAGDKVDARLVRSYVLESINNQKAGKKIESQKNQKLELPQELAAELKRDPALKKSFAALTPGRQREYANHVAGAKMASTRKTRMENAAPMIRVGIGLNDKYKNC